MNTANIITLRDFLRSDMGDHRFDMGHWGQTTPCGTVGCIAGTATILGAGRLSKRDAEEDYGRRWLGLSERNADHLFLPITWMDYLSPSICLLYGEPWHDLTSNLAPSLNTVEEMKKWARELSLTEDDEGHARYDRDRIWPRIGAPQAANALAGLLNHPGYVDWREAIETEFVES